MSRSIGQAPALRAGGFTLVEALVALVVLAVGMLGIASLYVTTLRSGTGSIMRTQAINLADDISDRIRANRNATVAYAAAAADKGCIGTGAVDCSAADMAATDLFYWSARIAQSLPGGTGTVTVAGAATPYTYQITVGWVEQGGVNQSYVLNVQI